jgi:hypothetical protein
MESMHTKHIDIVRLSFGRRSEKVIRQLNGLAYHFSKWYASGQLAHRLRRHWIHSWMNLRIATVASVCLSVCDVCGLRPELFNGDLPVWCKILCSIHLVIRHTKSGKNCTIFISISGFKCGGEWKTWQTQKRPKVFGWAQIIYLLNIEQSCIWLAQTWSARPGIQIFSCWSTAES